MHAQDATSAALSYAMLLGQTPAMAALRAQLQQLAAFDTIGNLQIPTVLLQGETGTGKGLVAQVMHASGPRSLGPFMHVNCAAIPDHLLEAELFGFEAGAFTDAKRAKPGLFEAATQGTLFLDEVEALPFALQSKLLTVLEDKRVRRLGAVRARAVDVKLIAATQAELPELVTAGRFRADLYHRLAVILLRLPPLRERLADIVLLAQYFLEQYATAYGLAPKQLTPAAVAWLQTYPWPGNVRELSHVMERVTLLHPGVGLDAAALEQWGVSQPGALPEPTVEASPEPSASLSEPARLRHALRQTGGNVAGAARLLGLSRNTMRYRMRQYGLTRPSWEALSPLAAPLTAPLLPASQAHPPDPAAAPASALPLWEQKPVAVLAIELTFPGSTTAKMEAAEPWTVTARWERMVEEQVESFGGTITQRATPLLTALFGVPRTLEQLPQRAVQAANSIRRLVQTARPTTVPGPQVRQSVHLGTVLVEVGGNATDLRLLALGDTVALPIRLLGHAGPGELLVSPEVGRQIAGGGVMQPRALPPETALSIPQQVYAVLEQRTGVASQERFGERVLSRFVGRERELALLQDRFAEVQTSRGQAVFIFGEAGIGKSRLLLEFRRQIEAAGARWLVGRCMSYGRGMAYLPILDVVRDLTGIQEADRVAPLLDKLETSIRRVADTLGWTVPFLHTILALDPGAPEVATMNPSQRRGRTVEALRALILGLSQRQPVVLCVEDLHWIDPHSEEVIGAWLESIATAPVLVLLAHRPGYTPPFGDQTYYTRLTLHGLSDTQMRAMVSRVLESTEVPAAVLELIARRAEGNPLFIEELGTALVEDGTLQRTTGGYRLTRPVSEATIPGTVQEVIMARLDRLPEAAKVALQVAAVIGREFTACLVERVLGAAREAAQALGELRAVELIYEKTLFPELTYMFKHALTHDVAYESLLRQRRRVLHQQVGEVIEALYAERLPELYETLAWHYVRGETWPKAVDYLLKTADQARARYAYAEATRHCTEAIAILEQHGGAADDKRRACEVLGDLQSLQGHVELANQAYDRALEVVHLPALQQRIVNKRHRPGVVVRDGARIAYYEHGTGAPTLLLMHPIIYGLGTFQPLLELLCQEFRIVTVDPRGVGGSDPLPGVYLIRDYVEDARAVIKATGDQPVVFIGKSRAGALAVNFAATYPHLVEKLVLIATRYAPPGTPGTPVDPERWSLRAEVRARGYAQAMRSLWKRNFTEPGSHDLIESFVQMSLELPEAVIENFALAEDSGLDLRPLLPTLRMPTLLLYGEEDRQTPLEVRHYFVDQIPGAQSYVFKGRGHELFTTAHVELAQVVQAFVRTGRVT